ncbi:MAG: hypothetical protein A2V88_13930 [Elusimicrobia bacterium RBG_16_66_12]|nr:MAG: hypothetical protein A2V88_13930 [Elusimicrobia bacterium RBG_16_66_12]
MNERTTAFAFLMFALLLTPAGKAAADGPGKIQDNSFLIEEAYNQERGVIQHIQAFQYLKRSRSWGYTFTQEWPAPDQTHQFSYTLPALRPGPPGAESGLGDVLLNYRYQAWAKGRTAFAPRASLILPTGDDKKGLGAGALGYQVNLPASVELSDEWVTHWNLGGTWTPGSKEPGGAKADTLGCNYGASLIWLAAQNFNLMFEAARNSFETIQSDGSKIRQDSFFLNPGARFAINFKSGLQIVPGVSLPIGVGPSRKEWGVLAYLSLEHPLF